ncbi:DUF6920 family protein [Salinarimonas chemoclinalis]|uniref:DUF6920 family protein n=1 Tax=Salinarimonas chemoclinalis TaxID=3241599 RepID=UPI003558539F
MKPGILFLIGGAALSLGTAGWLAWSGKATQEQITAHERSLMQAAMDRRSFVPERTSELPEPVQRYLAFVFPGGVPEDGGEIPAWIEFDQAGDFRRPQTESFAPTTARQVVATGAPDLVFAADTPVWGPIRAIAYDAFIDGEMEMEARVLSAVSVMHETSSPELDRISLRRWLLETPTNPYALLPGGLVEWEAIDENSARAVVEAHGHRASMVAGFDERGALISMHAEEDGDLTTPYHGSGEHVTRSDYRLVGEVRVPMAFEVSRMADGDIMPFWSGRITDVRFRRDDEAVRGRDRRNGPRVEHGRATDGEHRDIGKGRGDAPEAG